MTVRPSIHDVYSSDVDEKDAGVTTSEHVRVEGMSRCNVGRRSSSSSRRNKTDDTYVIPRVAHAGTRQMTRTSFLE